MSTSPNRALLKRVILLAILLPLVSLSQVKIKEKVEIKPNPAAQARMLSSTHDFFSPPLFVPGSTQLSLPSTLTISGSLSFAGQIANNQIAYVVYVKYRYGGFEQDQEVYWKGRASNGSYYEGQNPFTGSFGVAAPFPGPYSSIELFTYDGYGGWGTSVGQPVSYENDLHYSIVGSLFAVQVNATATVTGSSLPSARFNSWRINASSRLNCGQSTGLNISPLDSSGSYYAPYGASSYGGSFTVSVQAKGDYAFLQYGVQEGKQLTISLPQQDECYLILDTERGDIPGERDTAIVTVTGGGKTKSIPVELVCEKFDHLTIISSSPNVLVGSSVKLTVIAMDVNEQEVTLPEDFDVTLELYPDYIFSGSFSVDGGAPVRETLTVPYSLARAGRIRYLANDELLEGEDCTGVEIDVYRTSDEEKWGYTYEMIVKPICDLVTFSPSTLAPGDTATLTMQAGSGDTMFDLSILGDDGKSGTLVSAGGSGTALQGALGPFQYIAPATIDGSSKTIQVAAASYGSCGGGTPMRMDRSTTQTKALENATAQLLRKRLPLSQIHGLSLTSKVPRQTKVQPLSKQEQNVVMLSIAKRLAENLCAMAEVKVEANAPVEQCPDGQLVYDFETDWAESSHWCAEARSRLGATWIDGDQVELKPFGCFSVQNERWELRLDRLAVKILHAICSENLQANGFGADVNSASQVSKKDAPDVINAFTWALDRQPTGLLYYYSSQGMRLHEEAHTSQLQIWIIKLVQGPDGYLDRLRNITLPKNGAGSSADAFKKMQTSIDELSKEMNDRIYEPFNPETNPTQYSYNENAAIRATWAHYNSLIQALKKM